MSLECIDTQTTATPGASIIVLHGLGADGHDFVPVAREDRRPTRLLFIVRIVLCGVAALQRPSVLTAALFAVFVAYILAYTVSAALPPTPAPIASVCSDTFRWTKASPRRG